ncbi:MAG: DUF488 family protein [Pseudomonadota bacterium]
MIYSIGYQKKTLPELISILAAHKVTHLVDVRSKPYGRKVEFNKSKLEPALALVKSIVFHGLAWAGSEPSKKRQFPSWLNIKKIR